MGHPMIGLPRTNHCITFNSLDCTGTVKKSAFEFCVAGHQSGASGGLRSKPQRGKRTESRSRGGKRSKSAEAEASGLGRHYAAA